MTLLLGPPSSGKTTLLLALAGRLASGLKVHLQDNLSNSILGLQYTLMLLYSIFGYSWFIYIYIYIYISQKPHANVS
jgi:ABC-type cobalamin/Fe3+-siderophores transport system ATPase subunit